MAVKVTVVSPSKNRISINKQDRKEIRTVGVAPALPDNYGIDTLVALNDVDASDVDNNETLVFDESTGKFVVKVLPIINGGSY